MSPRGGRSGRELDEDDVRVRPQRGKSRPRSKDRPDHVNAEAGYVVAVDRGRFTCVAGDPHDDRPDDVEPTLIMAVKARELGRKGVVVGDRVAIVGDTSGETDALARIVRVEPRITSLRRTADDTDPVERIIVANADRLAVVVSLAEPAPQPRLVDRALVAAYDAGLKPLLVLTKSDLASPDELLADYAALNVDTVVLQRGSDLAELRALLHDQVTVFLGSSGVGKSTLVNALVPSAQRATGHVNESTGRGRHTSTSAVALPLPGGGLIVDTPGLRSFGLAHVDSTRVIDAFPEFVEGTTDCPRACSHDEEECGLDVWVAQGHAGTGGAERLSSLRRVLRSLADDQANG
ncbi:MAG: ribosome small subunit-dependent GTPase A [Actinomycetes bacterium]